MPKSKYGDWLEIDQTEPISNHEILILIKDYPENKIILFNMATNRVSNTICSHEELESFSYNNLIN